MMVASAVLQTRKMLLANRPLGDLLLEQVPASWSAALESSGLSPCTVRRERKQGGLQPKQAEAV